MIVVTERAREAAAQLATTLPQAANILLGNLDDSELVQVFANFENKILDSVQIDWNTVEHIARELYSADGFNVDHWDGKTGPRWKHHVEQEKPHYRDMALVALIEIKELYYE